MVSVGYTSPPSLPSEALLKVAGILPKSAVDVIQLENQFDPAFSQTDAGWNALWEKYLHTNMPKDLIDAMGEWKKFFITWRAMMTDPSQGGIFSADDQYDLVVTYVEQLKDWQAELARRGGQIAGPGVKPPEHTDSGTSVLWPATVALLAIALVGLALVIRH